MTPMDERDALHLLGIIEGRLQGMDERDARMEKILSGWEHRCQLCTTRFDDRLRACEVAQVRVTAIGSIIAIAVAYLPGWMRELWR